MKILFVNDNGEVMNHLAIEILDAARPDIEDLDDDNLYLDDDHRIREEFNGCLKKAQVELMPSDGPDIVKTVTTLMHKCITCDNFIKEEGKRYCNDCQLP